MTYAPHLRHAHFKCPDGTPRGVSPSNRRIHIFPGDRVKRYDDLRILDPKLGTVRAVMGDEGMAVVTWDDDPRPKHADLNSLRWDPLASGVML